MTSPLAVLATRDAEGEVMASFKAECVGGPKDGDVVDLGRAPQDGETLTSTKYRHTYRFDCPKMRWFYQGTRAAVSEAEPKGK